MGQFRGAPRRRTWLSGIAINLSREVLRRRARRPTVVLEDAPEPSVPPVRVGDRVDLERAIAALPPGSRMGLILHDIEGYTHEEIGARLRVSVGTSKSRLFAALRGRLWSPERTPHARRRAGHRGTGRVRGAAARAGPGRDARGAHRACAA